MKIERKGFCKLSAFSSLEMPLFPSLSLRTGIVSFFYSCVHRKILFVQHETLGSSIFLQYGLTNLTRNEFTANLPMALSLFGIYSSVPSFSIPLKSRRALSRVLSCNVEVYCSCEHTGNYNSVCFSNVGFIHR